MVRLLRALVFAVVAFFGVPRLFETFPLRPAWVPVFIGVVQFIAVALVSHAVYRLARRADANLGIAPPVPGEKPHRSFRLTK